MCASMDTGDYDRRWLTRKTSITKLSYPRKKISYLASIYNNAYRDYPEYADTMGKSVYNYLLHFWEKGTPEILVARCKEMIEGFIILDRNWETRNNEPVGEIHEFAVKYELKGHKIGYNLLRTGINYLTQSGTYNIGLWVGNNNKPALSLYKKLGFKVQFSDIKWTKMEYNDQYKNRIDNKITTYKFHDTNNKVAL
ncbi:MAG: GNAT family N-acetyltransferase [Clostridiales bacterium]|nr:GNAT family N-acetyltransferase [Clostridiales bacterium]MCF8022151.1 GNAT family N-acetyltransferase [Clostridiales bacterium]